MYKTIYRLSYTQFITESGPQPCTDGCFKAFTWMSQEVSKGLACGL